MIIKMSYSILLQGQFFENRKDNNYGNFSGILVVESKSAPKDQLF